MVLLLPRAQDDTGAREGPTLSRLGVVRRPPIGLVFSATSSRLRPRDMPFDVSLSADKALRETSAARPTFVQDAAMGLPPRGDLGVGCGKGPSCGLEDQEEDFEAVCIAPAAEERRPFCSEKGVEDATAR